VRRLVFLAKYSCVRGYSRMRGLSDKGDWRREDGNGGEGEAKRVTSLGDTAVERPGSGGRNAAERGRPLSFGRSSADGSLKERHVLGQKETGEELAECGRVKRDQRVISHEGDG